MRRAAGPGDGERQVAQRGGRQRHGDHAGTRQVREPAGQQRGAERVADRDHAPSRPTADHWLPRDVDADQQRHAGDARRPGPARRCGRAARAGRSTMATPTATSGTAATSRPVSELVRCCSARVSSSHGMVISIAVKTSSGASGAAPAAPSPWPARPAAAGQRAERRPGEHQGQRAELLDGDLDQQVRDAPGDRQAREQEHRATTHALILDPTTVQSIYDLFMSTLSRDFTIDLRRLRVLRMLDQRGTVSAAAAALHLTPSAVSQQIAGLARETGVQLLEKRGRGVRLTGRARLPARARRGHRAAAAGRARRPGQLGRRRDRPGQHRLAVDRHHRDRRPGPEVVAPQPSRAHARRWRGRAARAVHRARPR